MRHPDRLEHFPEDCSSESKYQRRRRKVRMNVGTRQKVKGSVGIDSLPVQTQLSILKTGVSFVQRNRGTKLGRSEHKTANPQMERLRAVRPA